MRFENKFVVPKVEFNKNLFKISVFGFIRQHNDRKVNSIYFDDLMLSGFYENLEGSSNRTKMRLRWYGDIDYWKSNYLALEVKEKRSSRGWKNVFKIEGSLKREDLNNQLLKILLERSADNKSEELGHCIHMLSVETPVVKIQYFRSYLYSNILNCRLTIDRSLSGNIIRPDISKKGFYLNGDNLVVCELKYDVSNESLCKSYINSLSLSPRSFSKYSWLIGWATDSVLANVDDI